MDSTRCEISMIPVLLAALSTGALEAHGINEVLISPKAPTTDDAVDFTVKGYFSDFCDRTILGGEALASLSDGIVTLWIKAQGPADGAGCPLPAIRNFETAVAGGRFPFGSYRVDVRLEVDEYGKIDVLDYPGVAGLEVGAGQKPPEVERVEVDPPDPGAQDQVALIAMMTVVECIARVDKTTATVEGDRIRIQVEVYVPPALCPPHPQALQAEADLGQLPPGSYTVDVEMVYFFVDPFWTGDFPAVRTFTVTGGELPLFRRGDCNSDGGTDLSDAVADLLFLFAGQAVACQKACDTNGSGALDLTDAIYLLEYLFLAGPPLPDPAAACGRDGSALGCAEATGGCG